MEEKIARAEQEKTNKENTIITLESDIKNNDQHKEELFSKRSELTNNINKQQAEINKSTSKLMENDNKLNYNKQEISKIKSAISHTEKKRSEESEVREDLNLKLNHHQAEHRRIDDRITNEEKNIYD